MTTEEKKAKAAEDAKHAAEVRRLAMRKFSQKGPEENKPIPEEAPVHEVAVEDQRAAVIEAKIIPPEERPAVPVVSKSAPPAKASEPPWFPDAVKAAQTHEIAERERTQYTTITLTPKSIARMSSLQMEAVKGQGGAGMIPRALSTSEVVRLALLICERVGNVTVEDLLRFKAEDARSSSWGERGARRAAWRKGKE